MCSHFSVCRVLRDLRWERIVLVLLSHEKNPSWEDLGTSLAPEEPFRIYLLSNDLQNRQLQLNLKFVESKGHYFYSKRHKVLAHNM
jgi:hypothetical protein